MSDYKLKGKRIWSKPLSQLKDRDRKEKETCGEEEKRFFNWDIVAL